MSSSRSIGCAAVLTLAGAALAQPAYTLTALPGLSDSGLTGISDISDAGVVLGNVSPHTDGRLPRVRLRPARWVNGQLSVMPHLPGGGGINAAAGACNSNGITVGTSGYRGAPDIFFTHAVMWRGDRITDLGTLPGHVDSLASAVNDAGVIVGYSAPDYYFFGGSRAFRYENGAMAALPELPGQIDSGATGINNAGTIVGSAGDVWGLEPWSVAVFWDNTGVHELPLPAGAEGSEAAAINNTGVIVGRAGVMDITQFDPMGAFTPVRWAGGAAEDLPLLEGDTFGNAVDINESGVIVGNSGLVDPEFGFIVSQRPVVWVNGEVVDLGAAVDFPAEWADFTFYASGINNNGQVCGSCWGFDAAGEFVGHGWVATPN